MSAELAGDAPVSPAIRRQPASVRLPADFTYRSIVKHGFRLAYIEAGPPDAHPLVLVHGLAGSARSWETVMPALAEEYRVIALDLAGHGQTDKPTYGDYSIPGLALHIRDLLLLLGVRDATMIGHSLGGGVVMQVSYQWPELVGRMVLVCSGGLGRAVTSFLRLLAIPGIGQAALPIGARPGMLHKADEMRHKLGPWGRRPKVDDFMRCAEVLLEPDARAAFLNVIRGCIGPGGQRVSAVDRLHLAAAMPVQIMWGENDQILSVGHAHRAHAMVQGSRLHLFENSGHFPHLDEPEEFLRVLFDFLETTTPSTHTAQDMLGALVGTPPEVARAPEPEDAVKSDDQGDDRPA